VHDHATIQTCWDAERLDLGRVKNYLTMHSEEMQSVKFRSYSLNKQVPYNDLRVELWLIHVHLNLNKNWLRNAYKPSSD
jgi:hypothetical protein